MYGLNGILVDGLEILIFIPTNCEQHTKECVAYQSVCNTLLQLRCAIL